MAPAGEKKLATDVKNGIAVEISTKNISSVSDQFKEILIFFPKEASLKDFSLTLSEGEDFTFLIDPVNFGLESLGKGGPTLILESDQDSFAAPFSVAIPISTPAASLLLEDPKYGLLLHYKLGADYFFEILSGSSINVSNGILSASIDRPGILEPIHMSGVPSPNKIATLLTSEMVRDPQKTSAQYRSYRVIYSSNNATSGTVPSDSQLYTSAQTVIVLGNSGGLQKTGYDFMGWSVNGDGSGSSYLEGQTFTIAADTTLYAKWDMKPPCSGLEGGTWVAVPGDRIYGTSDFCVMKYEAKNMSGVATSQAANLPWGNITQTDAMAACSSLGAGVHLITNNEWLTLATNIANVASNWSGGSVGSGFLNRGNSDNITMASCAASTDDSYAYVQADCAVTNMGTWSQKRTHTLSTGAVVWDLAGNAYDWTSYVISDINDKPYVSSEVVPQDGWKELSAVDAGFTAMTLHDLRPIHSEKSFWSGSWNSNQGIGKYWAGTNGTGGALHRGGPVWGSEAAGVFAASLYWSPSDVDADLSYRCAALR